MAGDVFASRERLRAFLDAVVGIGSDLDLRTMLQRIVAGHPHDVAPALWHDVKAACWDP